MFDDPVEERPLETDIIPGFLAFNPFMAQNLLALSQELLVEHRIFHQLCGVFFRGFHLLFGEFQHLALGVNQNLMSRANSRAQILSMASGKLDLLA
jgi:hypothetical protein